MALKLESKKKKKSGHKDVQTNHCAAKRPENASKTLTYPAYKGCFLVSFFKRSVALRLVIVLMNLFSVCHICLV